MPDPFEHPLIAAIYDAVPSHQGRPDVAFYTGLATTTAGWLLALSIKGQAEPVAPPDQGIQ